MATVESTLYGDDTYTYDGNGDRVEKASGKLYWYGAGGEVLAESDASGNITDKYVFFDGERLARIDASGNVDYYLSDKLGSASVVTDANGVKVDDCDYLPYGQTNCITSSSGNHYLYTGLERDADQLDHTPHRQYSSSFGRWMSPDPGGVKVVNMDTPQTWNLYAYVADNPTTDTDPTGLSSQDNTNGGCATLRNCNDDRKSLDHPPGQELNSGTNTNQANMLTATVQGTQVTVSAQQQGGEKPSSWTPDKPLPNDPTGLGPDWKRDPGHKAPNEERYVNDKTGDKLDWNKGKPGGGKRWKDNPHWHWVPGGEKEKGHYEPGDTIKRVGGPVGVGVAVGVVIHAIIEAAPELIPVLAFP